MGYPEPRADRRKVPELPDRASIDPNVFKHCDLGNLGGTYKGLVARYLTLAQVHWAVPPVEALQSFLEGYEGQMSDASLQVLVHAMAKAFPDEMKDKKGGMLLLLRTRDRRKGGFSRVSEYGPMDELALIRRMVHYGAMPVGRGSESATVKAVWTLLQTVRAEGEDETNG